MTYRYNTSITSVVLLFWRNNKILQTQGSTSQLKSYKSRYYKTLIWQTSPKCFGEFLEEFSVRLGVKLPATVVQQTI